MLKSAESSWHQLWANDGHPWAVFFFWVFPQLCLKCWGNGVAGFDGVLLVHETRKRCKNIGRTLTFQGQITYNTHYSGYIKYYSRCWIVRFSVQFYGGFWWWRKWIYDEFSWSVLKRRYSLIFLSWHHVGLQGLAIFGKIEQPLIKPQFSLQFHLFL